MSDRCGDCECCATHKEELANRDMEWWEALAGVDAVAPTPEAVKAFQLSLNDQVREEVMEGPLVRGCIEVVAEINRRWGATSYADALETIEKLLAGQHEPCERRAELKREEAADWCDQRDRRIAELEGELAETEGVLIRTRLASADRLQELRVLLGGREDQTLDDAIATLRSRIDQLLQANNEEVERRRAAEAAASASTVGDLVRFFQEGIPLCGHGWFAVACNVCWRDIMGRG